MHLAKKNLQLKWNALLDEFQEAEANNPAPLPHFEIPNQTCDDFVTIAALAEDLKEVARVFAPGLAFVFQEFSF